MEWATDTYDGDTDNIVGNRRFRHGYTSDSACDRYSRCENSIRQGQCSSKYALGKI